MQAHKQRSQKQIIGTYQRWAKEQPMSETFHWSHENQMKKKGVKFEKALSSKKTSPTTVIHLKMEVT